MVRDGRGFCFSYLKNRGLRKNDLKKAIDEWMGYISLIEDLEKRYPTIDIKTIRYEDLCRDPEGQMKEVFEFLLINAHAMLFPRKILTTDIINRQFSHGPVVLSVFVFPEIVDGNPGCHHGMNRPICRRESPGRHSCIRRTDDASGDGMSPEPACSCRQKPILRNRYAW